MGNITVRPPLATTTVVGVTRAATVNEVQTQNAGVNLIVAPGTMKYHPGMCTAAAVADNGTAPVNITGGYNVASLTVSSNVYTFTFATAMTQTDYKVGITVEALGGYVGSLYGIQVLSKSTSGFTYTFNFITNSGPPGRPASIAHSVTVTGGLA